MRAGGSNSVVESQPSKLLVAGSIPVSRSSLCSGSKRASAGRPLNRLAAGRHRRLVGRSRDAAEADVAQLAERVLGKDEVTSSILVIGSILRSRLPTASGRRRTERVDETAAHICSGFDSDVTEDENAWLKKNSIAANRT